MADFRFAADEPYAGELGIMVAYAIRHADGVLLFDTGFGIGNAEIDAVYRPRAGRATDILARAGIGHDEVRAVVNCHLHIDHAGQNHLFPGVPIYVQPAEMQSAREPDYTVLEWIHAPGLDYRRIAGDHEPIPGIRVIASPGHTPGHQSLLVETAGGSVLLVGQAVYSLGEW